MSASRLAVRNETDVSEDADFRPNRMVSVIIIFLNAEKFMQEAIDSVFAQIYRDWELWLVDDGSTDASTEMARLYAQRYPGQVGYLEHKDHQNRGMSASRNLGIQHAKGHYIAFLDADDVWLPHKLEQQVALLESHSEAAMVYGPAQQWYSWARTSHDSHGDSVIKRSGGPSNVLLKPPTLLPHLLRETVIEPLPSGILVRRAVVDQIGGFEEAFRGIFEDLVFCTKLCLEAPILIVDECWYRWRQHPESCCALVERQGQYPSAWLMLLSWLEGYLSEKKVTDREVWRVLQEKLWPYRHPTLYHLLSRTRRRVQQMQSLLRLIARRTLPPAARLWLQRFR